MTRRSNKSRSAARARRPKVERRSRAQTAAPAHRIGEWTMIGLAGVGRFSRVYRARPAECPEDWPADYALKVLANESDRAAQAMLENEARVGQQVRHPHLVSVLDFGLSDAPRFLVQPFLEGSTLRASLDLLGAAPVSQSLWYARQTCEALRQLHHCGWRHGDVKPANIMCSPEGHATLMDLGFAARNEQGPRSESAPLMTSPAYAAPEQFDASLALGAAADVYSLGATLFELLTGRTPFHRDNLSELAEAHVSAAIPDPRKWRPQLPAPLARLLRQMLSKDASDRPTSDALARRLVELEIECFDDCLAGATW